MTTIIVDAKIEKNLDRKTKRDRHFRQSRLFLLKQQSLFHENCLAQHAISHDHLKRV